MTAMFPVTAGTVLQVAAGQADTSAQRFADASSNADSPGWSGRTDHWAGDDGGTPGAGRGASLAERGYVQARFGGVPVLVGPEFAAQLRAIREEQP